MVVSKITLVQWKIHSTSSTLMGVGLSSIQVLNVLSIKQEITLKEFSSLQNVKDTAEGFTKSILQKYVVIFCIVRPNPISVKKLFSLKECRSGAMTSNPQFSFLCCLDEYCLFEFLWSFIKNVVYFFLASPCMSSLLSNPWLGLARLLSAEEQNTPI